jgi:hypothetical protein
MNEKRDIRKVEQMIGGSVSSKREMKIKNPFLKVRGSITEAELEKIKKLIPLKKGV